MSPADKVLLFRSLFRGRQDVFPTRFESKKSGKAGYAPACSNKFVRGLCDLPKVKCGECPNQAFLPVDDAAIVAHLRGRHVMGVYPMLPDETCWFLAVDFDEADWMDDVSAFVETCRHMKLPVSIEKSRSGNGAHAWFFFSEPVPATVARQMGCHVITETMSRRHELDMKSYDRLFPSQDTMPRGGFGNLIALPLQHGPRQEGKSVFLDDKLAPYPKEQQWAYLATVPRIALETVESIAADAVRADRVIGAQMVDTDDDEPWLRSPSRKPRPLRITTPLPTAVKTVLAQRLFVEKAGLPAPLISEMKRLAAFQNPEFYKRQAMRMSTALTPRVIGCAENLPAHLALPRGLLPDLEALLRSHSVSLEVDDQRTEGDAIDARFRGTLTKVQENAAMALMRHHFGVFVAPPGVGKTVVGAFMMAARGRSTLVLVHRRPLVDQWIAQLSLFLGIDPKHIGQIGGGKRKRTGRIDVAMIQSLVKKDAVADIVAAYGHVIVDECHHLPAVSFERVLAEVKARFVLGLTATPQRRDGHHPITTMQLGPVRFAVDAKAQAAARPFTHKLIVRETQFRASDDTAKAGIQVLCGAAASDEARNDLIVADVGLALELGRCPLVLTERRDHLEVLALRLARFDRDVIVLRGGMGAKESKATQGRLAASIPGRKRLVLATGKYIGEGFDDAQLDTLFLAFPISWKGTLEQYAGRLHRIAPGKTGVQIFDYVDREIPMLVRMFEKRLRGYRAIGYARGEAPLGFGESGDEPVLDFDEPVLRSFYEDDDGDDWG